MVCLLTLCLMGVHSSHVWKAFCTALGETASPFFWLSPLKCADGKGRPGVRSCPHRSAFLVHPVTLRSQYIPKLFVRSLSLPLLTWLSTSPVSRLRCLRSKPIWITATGLGSKLRQRSFTPAANQHHAPAPERGPVQTVRLLFCDLP